MFFLYHGHRSNHQPYLNSKRCLDTILAPCDTLFHYYNPMNNTNLKQTLTKNDPNSASMLFQTLLMHKTGQLSEEDLLSPYRTNRKLSNQDKQINIIAQLLEGVAEDACLDFHQAFVYGVEMEMWRKERIKKISVFLDPNLPNLVWFSTTSKAFLLDMTYTDIDRCKFQLQKASGVKSYFILRYFGEQIPLLFRGEHQPKVEKYFHLFNNYIRYNRLRQYPPFFSRIMKQYTIEEIKSSISRMGYASDILKVTEMLSIEDPKFSRKVMEDVYFKSKKEKLKNDSQLAINEISDYFKILHCSQALIGVFEKYSKAKMGSHLDYLEKIMKNKHFVDFLIAEQKMTTEKAEITAKTMNEQINFYEFCTFLQNQKLNHAAEQIEINEDLPLTDYFCYSSHNTYLSGNQLTSDCKIERYLEDLGRGLKCVEIDIHNDGDVPIINHAVSDTSFCKPIDFQETIKNIAKFLETCPSHYPIILSIQNHAKEENRYKVSNILLKYLFKKIFFLSEELPYGDPVYFKTLKELRGKIIIKTDSKLAEITAFKKKEVFETKKQTLKLHSPAPKFPSKLFQQRFDKFQENIIACTKRRQEFDMSIPNSLFLPISEMSKLTGLFKSQKGVDNTSSVGYECTSLTNQKAAKSKEQKIVEYTKRSFLRIYPLGTEIASSNYDPVPHLRIGAQIIALNTQTKDQSAWMLMSYFKAGRNNNFGNIGYIQKPEHLRTAKVKIVEKKRIKITVITDDEQVNISFYGSERDRKANNKSKDTFQTIDHDQAFLFFNIGDGLKQCIPVRFIREGYRVLVAKNDLFLDSGVRIVVHIAIDTQRKQ